MSIFIKFPSIERFDDYFNAKSSEYHAKNPREWVLYGSPKLHGANSSIVFAWGKMQTQSRNRIITPEDDNMDFAKFASNPEIREFLEPRVQAIVNSFQQSEEFLNLLDVLPKGTIIGGAIFGEWCGQGVQKTVGVSKVDRFFAPFDVCALYQHENSEVVTPLWLNTEFLDGFRNEELRILPVSELWTIKLHTNSSAEVKAAFEEMQSITLQVDQECPFAKIEFGVEGIGEGVVWRTNDLINPVRIKVKGDKHKGSDKTRIKVIDHGANAAFEFTNSKIDNRRCEQAIEYLNEFKFPIDKSSTGKFVQWIVQDILKEDLREAEELGIQEKHIKKAAPKIAREHFERYLREGNF